METSLFKVTKVIDFVKGYEDSIPNFFENSDEDYSLGQQRTFEFFDDDGNYAYKLQGKVVAFIEDNCETGHLSEELQLKIDMKIRGYNMNFQKLKIGITGRPPHLRFMEHLENFNWKKKVILYRTKSEVYVRAMEKYLVAKHWNFIENETGGGGGKIRKDGYNYVYVILA